jgi:hypothetical protein
MQTLSELTAAHNARVQDVADAAARLADAEALVASANRACWREELLSGRPAAAVVAAKAAVSDARASLAAEAQAEQAVWLSLHWARDDARVKRQLGWASRESTLRWDYDDRA